MSWFLLSRLDLAIGTLSTHGIYKMGGIFLAPILCMKKFVVLLFIFVAANPHVTFAQKNSTEHAKQRRAEQVADRFVNRFQATLDFGMAWKAFRLSDPSCTHRANGILDQSDYERLKLNSRTIEKLYIAMMNYYYLMNVHDLSLAGTDSQSDSGDSSTPNEVKVIAKRSKFYQNDDRKPQNARERWRIDQYLRSIVGALPKGHA